MKIDSFINMLRQQFVENTDVGLLLNLKPEQFNSKFKFHEMDEKFLDLLCEGHFSDEKPPKKTDILFYLSYSVCLNSLPTTRKHFRKADFHEKFWRHWTERFNRLKTLFNIAQEYFSAETINDEDLVYINVTETPAVTIFIISKEKLIKQQIDTHSKNRTLHILRDIKKIEAKDHAVVISYHGQQHPDTIEISDAKSAIKLQDNLTMWRNNRK